MATTRKTKTPQQRAEETLAAARRTVGRCEKRVEATSAAFEAAKGELVVARTRAAYAADNPDLPDDPEPDEVATGSNDPTRAPFIAS